MTDPIRKIEIASGEVFEVPESKLKLSKVLALMVEDFPIGEFPNENLYLGDFNVDIVRYVLGELTRYDPKVTPTPLTKIIDPSFAIDAYSLFNYLEVNPDIVPYKDLLENIRDPEKLPTILSILRQSGGINITNIKYIRNNLGPGETINRYLTEEELQRIVYLATSDKDRLLKIYQPDGILLQTVNFPEIVNFIQTLEYSPDGSKLAVVRGDTLYLLNVSPIYEFWRLYLPNLSWATSIRFSLDGNYLAVGDSENVHIINIPHNIYSTIHVFRRGYRQVGLRLPISPDLQNIIVYNDRRDPSHPADVNPLEIVNLLNPEDIVKIDLGEISKAAAFSPDGQTIAVLTEKLLTNNLSLRIFNRHGEKIREIFVGSNNNTYPLFTLLYLHDRIIISRPSEGSGEEILVWDLHTNQLEIIHHDPRKISQLAVSGNILAVLFRDGEVILINLISREVTPLNATGVLYLTLSPI